MHRRDRQESIGRGSSPRQSDGADAPSRERDRSRVSIDRACSRPKPRRRQGFRRSHISLDSRAGTERARRLPGDRRVSVERARSGGGLTRRSPSSTLEMREFPDSVVLHSVVLRDEALSTSSGSFSELRVRRMRLPKRLAGSIPAYFCILKTLRLVAPDTPQTPPVEQSWRKPRPHDPSLSAERPTGSSRRDAAPALRPTSRSCAS